MKIRTLRCFSYLVLTAVANELEVAWIWPTQLMSRVKGIPACIVGSWHCERIVASLFFFDEGAAISNKFPPFIITSAAILDGSHARELLSCS